MAIQQEFIGKVSSLSDQGFGVVKHPDNGQVYFVRGVWPGDEGRFQEAETAEPLKGRYRFADLKHLTRASTERRDPLCSHFGIGHQQCYGCPWIIAPYEAQMRIKVDRLRYGLKRVGLDPDRVQEIWGAPHEFAYRRRAQFKSNGYHIGYAGKQGRELAPIDDCLILSPKLSEIFHKLKSKLPNEQWRPSEDKAWTFFDVDESSDPDQIVLNRRMDFAQVHQEQNQRMKQWIADQIHHLRKDTPILELFAGSGNFTETLVARGFTNILAVEVNPDAVQRLASRNLPGVKAVALDLYRKGVIQKLAQWAKKVGILMVNPPRAGLQNLVYLPRHLPQLQHIFYISCHLKTFAPNARRLQDLGFPIQEIQPVDQMPQTPHLEILASFARNKPS